MAIRTHDPASSTRDRLFAAARELFPERGFRDATTAKICSRARANGAAVNYHFGGKAALYVAVWRSLLDEVVGRVPGEEAHDAGAPPEERLRRRIRGLLDHMTQEGPLGRLVLQELVRPTGLIDDLRREALAPARRGMTELLRELLGKAASERDVSLCELSVVNQCLALRLKPLHLDDLQRQGAATLDLDELADHVTRFSLAGIRRVRGVAKARRR